MVRRLMTGDPSRSFPEYFVQIANGSLSRGSPRTGRPAEPRNELSLVSRYRGPVCSADRAALVYQPSFCYDDVPLFSPCSRVSFQWRKRGRPVRSAA